MRKFSSDAITRRLAHLPSPIYTGDLPVHARREEIMEAIDHHQVVIICGETGSGKTTQLPKICLELKRGVKGLIGHTQPRRIAARTVAARIASELNSPLGQAVGYKIRFTDKVSTDSYIKLMTDGILLAETQSDPLLQAYDTLIIDEAHERSLNIDFLLGYLSQLLPKRPDLKLIVTSATIDAERFSKHFDHAPVIEVTGRLYPVEICYRPLSADDEESSDLQLAILSAIDELIGRGPGDILIFLPGEREIRETAEALRKHHYDHSRPGLVRIDILPLFARLSVAEQEKVFQPTGNTRRIVLATNVAETSLTVPGIHYVIDTGLARINRYSYRNKVEQLLVEKISQASANQRAGRCGRVAQGVCIRLYSENDFHARSEYTDPEILRSSLAAVILRMKSLKIGDVENFPFLEPPSPRMIGDGYQLLAELGAVDENKGLTAIGWRLAKFPMDPRIARMILAAKQENCLREILIIASALSLQDPRDRPFDHQAAADQAQRRFVDERSDFMSYLKLWDFFDEQVKHKKSTRKLIAQCHDLFLSYRRLREWREIHGQLQVLISEMGLKPSAITASYDEIHRALLAGLLGNIGFKTEKEGEYLGARGIKFAIFPGSTLKKGKTKWVVAAELIETTKLYARCVAQIDPNWLERIAGNLCKRHYFDPHWEKKQAQVMAYERMTLYGLMIVPKRPVHYGTINRIEAREIFIRAALVAGEYLTQAAFFIHNQTLVHEIEELEHKARRQDVLVDEQQIFAFYDAIIPQHIVNGGAFEKWRKQAESVNPQILYLQREMLMRHDADRITEVQFPEHLLLPDGNQLPLTYRFDPGHVLDGVTVVVPLPLLNRLDAKQLDYLVPGLIREKVTWYFKSLPKPIRRMLVPLPESVTAFLENLNHAESPALLQDAMSQFILCKTTIAIPSETWKTETIPLHLSMNIQVVDDSNKELMMSRNLIELQQQFGQQAQATFAATNKSEKHPIERDSIAQWDFAELPITITFIRHGQSFEGYPTLVDCGDSVAIRILDTASAADDLMRAGVKRLLCLALKEQIKQLEKNIPGLKLAAMQFSNRMNPGDLKQDLFNAILDRALLADDPLPRSENEFHAQKQRAKQRLPDATAQLTQLLQQIGTEYQHVHLQLAEQRNHDVQHELHEQLEQLIFTGFLGAIPWKRLLHLPRYLKGIKLRLEKFASNPERDMRNRQEVSVFWQKYCKYLAEKPPSLIKNEHLEEFRWQIEELRISLFAQELKTPQPISSKRLKKLWENIQT
ncbi:ATP-dependent helicase HrpA [Nitrosomonas sp. PY1]|uniref:ATP-dependent RNA helicase HrpA n=1 Tax=Nitrosomonas sp. PY1 TaxID=1803906 RepID=UPI001FC895D4|nr:ATP-dependent RNA helicase HrpA [Nitrosomonas sp. PY1]GKS68536.1 ATP-dependent helicase HrpA [Nitrosomonas sp. PY1]